MTFEEEFEEILFVFFKISVNYMVVGGRRYAAACSAAIC